MPTIREKDLPKGMDFLKSSASGLAGPQATTVVGWMWE